MRSLYTKLALTFVLLIVILGGCFYALDKYNVRLYYEELSQRLNASIAMYVVDSLPLLEAGQVNQDNLASLAQQAMVVNPTAEIYLLDASGQILGHGVTPNDVIQQQIDVTPLQALIAGTAKLPIKALDPKSNHIKKIFSAHPIVENSATVGYLYVVLGGSRYDQLAAEVGTGYWQKMMVSVIVLLSFLIILFGLVSFGLITKRLKRLNHKVSNFAQGDFRFTDQRHLKQLHEQELEAGNDDEIDQLNSAFNKMALKLTEQFEHLQENDKLRRELITNISHDLRTPLASMQGYLETLMIKDTQLSSAERKKYLSIARKHTRHLNRLIADLFELAKLDSGRISPNMEDFSLFELIHDVAQEFQLEAEQRQISISLNLPKVNPMVYADIALIQRVLENLIKNALRFTPAGGQISMDIHCNQHSAVVVVADNGYGIKSQDLPRIFDRFYRSKHGQESKADSTGLGLAIVKRILDLHNTRIQVSSKLHQGSRFQFALPARIPAELAA